MTGAELIGLRPEGMARMRKLRTTPLNEWTENDAQFFCDVANRVLDAAPQGTLTDRESAVVRHVATTMPVLAELRHKD